MRRYSNLLLALGLLAPLLVGMVWLDLLTTWALNDPSHPTCQMYSGKCHWALIGSGAGTLSMMALTFIVIVCLQLQAVHSAMPQRKKLRIPFLA